jgi:hypothetical protein
MKTRALCAIVLLVAAAAALAANGCSVIGYTMGVIDDARKPDTSYVPAWNAEVIKPGSQIKVVLNDGKQLTGEYAGLRRIRKEKYANRYAEFREQKHGETFIPALGDTITITMKSGRQTERELLGFDYQYVGMELKGQIASKLAASAPIVSVREVGDTASSALFLKNIEKIVDSDGNVTEGEALARLASEGQIPFLSGILVVKGLVPTQVPADNVRRIEVANQKDAKLKGLRTGLALDVGAAIVALIILSSMDIPFGD